MGELVASSTAGEVIGVIGLGSCIGLALVDCDAGIAGVAHVVLPHSRGEVEPVGKFANLAVPALIDAVVERGAVRSRLEAVIVGGARMFELGNSADIGASNEAAVRAQLARERIPVIGAATGGSRGRSLRIDVAGGRVVAQEAGSPPLTLVDNNLAERVA